MAGVKYLLAAGSARFSPNWGMRMSSVRRPRFSTPLLVLAFCMVLFLSTVAEASVHAQSWADHGEPLRALKGSLVLRVYPNGTVKAKATGGLEEAFEHGEARLPVMKAAFNFSLAGKGFNLTEARVNLFLKPDPQVAPLLSGLRLNLTVHSEQTRSDASLDFDLPGLLGANGTIHVVHTSESLEGATMLHLTLRLWYGQGTLGNGLGITRELIEDLVADFDLYEEVFRELLSGYTDGNLTLTELKLERVELQELYGSLTVRAEVNGSWVRASSALASAFAPQTGNVRQIQRLAEELAETSFTRALSANTSILYDRVEDAFRVEFTELVEGDVDREVNTVKNICLRSLDESMPQTGFEASEQLKAFLLSMNVSVRNLHAALEYHSAQVSHGFSFSVEGLSFQPTRPEGVLLFLRDSSFKTPMPGLNLTLEGGSDEHEMVEIRVPRTVAAPLSANAYRAVWALANVTNLDQVQFETKPNR
ncbi:MAG: hypothetical protein QW057_07775, partial [Candidatus Bathyarchaeia archaeon]